MNTQAYCFGENVVCYIQSEVTHRGAARGDAVCSPPLPWQIVFTARRYASAVFATSRCCIETTGRTELVFGIDSHRGFLPLIPHCVVKKFGYFRKLEYFPLVLCPKLRN